MLSCRPGMGSSCVSRQRKFSEKKKGAIGVRGIKLKKDDELENVYLFVEGTEAKVAFKEREVTLNRLKVGKRDTQGVKSR